MSRKPDDIKKLIARELYVVSGLSAKATAIKAGCSERTLLDWRKAEKWDEARELSGFDKTSLNENLYALAHTASKFLKENIEKGVIDAHQINAMRQLVVAIQRSDAYEKSKETDKPKKKSDATMHGRILQRMGLA